VSILTEQEYAPLENKENSIGIDLGLKDLVITSDGVMYENPKFLNKYQNKLSKLQRQMSKKQVGSYQ